MTRNHPTPEQVRTGHYVEYAILEAMRDWEEHPELYEEYEH